MNHKKDATRQNGARQNGNRENRIREEHGHLRRMIDNTLETVTARAAAPAVIAEMFAGLAEHVQDHFQHEEVGGYFAEALEFAPRLSERAAELLSQHPQLAAQLDELQSHLCKPPSTENWWKDLEKMFRRFVDDFNEHEAKENDLLQQAYSVDIGAED